MALTLFRYEQEDEAKEKQNSAKVKRLGPVEYPSNGKNMATVNGQNIIFNNQTIS